jgi:hypothetical protein
MYRVATIFNFVITLEHFFGQITMCYHKLRHVPYEFIHAALET